MVSCRYGLDNSNIFAHCKSCNGILTTRSVLHAKEAISFKLKINKNMLVLRDSKRSHCFRPMSPNHRLTR